MTHFPNHRMWIVTKRHDIVFFPATCDENWSNFTTFQHEMKTTEVLCSLLLTRIKLKFHLPGGLSTPKIKEVKHEIGTSLKDFWARYQHACSWAIKIAEVLLRSWFLCERILVMLSGNALCVVLMIKCYLFRSYSSELRRFEEGFYRKSRRFSRNFPLSAVERFIKTQNKY